MKRYVLAIVVGILGFVPPVWSQEKVSYTDLRCSPTGRYLSFLEWRFKYVQRQNRKCMELETTSSVVITDALGKRIRVILPRKKQEAKIAWDSGDRLIVVDEGEFEKGCAVYDVQGRRVGTVPVKRGSRYIDLQVSPDGRYLAYAAFRPFPNIYLVIMDLQKNGRLVADLLLGSFWKWSVPSSGDILVWSPSSRRLAFLGGESTIVVELSDFPRWDKPLVFQSVTHRDPQGQIVLTDGFMLDVCPEGYTRWRMAAP